MDGAGEFTILFKIFIPLSAPVIATIYLWTAVAHWNWWLDALIYITDDSKQVLKIVPQSIAIEQGLTDMNLTEYTPETIKAVAVVVTVIPMLLVYPFVQRYFVKGIMLGGVKE
jgi:putative aldouronate transport system permease protein